MSKLPDHLFVGDSTEGALFDTRVEGWSKLPPLRPNYSFTHSDIKSVADLKATLRNGKYAWPGGYPLFFISNDGQAYSFEGVERDLRECVYDIANRVGSRIVACAINYEDADLTCDITDKRIESAYGESEDA